MCIDGVVLSNDHADPYPRDGVRSTVSCGAVGKRVFLYRDNTLGKFIVRERCSS